MAMSDCAVCAGEVEPWVVIVTGNWAHVDRVRYGDTDYYVHGARFRKGVTTWWLAPVTACGEA